jgi:hypothetical protein
VAVDDAAQGDADLVGAAQGRARALDAGGQGGQVALGGGEQIVSLAGALLGGRGCGRR